MYEYVQTYKQETETKNPRIFGAVRDESDMERCRKTLLLADEKQSIRRRDKEDSLFCPQGSTSEAVQGYSSERQRYLLFKTADVSV